MVLGEHKGMHESVGGEMMVWGRDRAPVWALSGPVGRDWHRGGWATRGGRGRTGRLLCHIPRMQLSTGTRGSNQWCSSNDETANGINLDNKQNPQDDIEPSAMCLEEKKAIAMMSGSQIP